MKCLHDDDCGFLYNCDSNLQCQHDHVFPLSLFTICIYLLIPIGSGLVNSTGHSMGLFKVLIVMNLLRYQGIQATMVSQAMIVGTALPNYFSILVRKHPTLQTSLVNFNLVYILVPCCLLGSTLGSLVAEFVPNFVQEVLTFLVFSYFAWSFYQKYRKIKSKEIQHQSSILTHSITNSIVEETKPQNISPEGQLLNDSPEERLVKSNNSKNQDKLESLQQSSNFKSPRNEIIEYERTYHSKDIFFSILVFLVFEFLVFLVQGRLPFLEFGHCDWKYWTGLCLLVALTLGYLKFVHIYLKKKFQVYESLEIHQQIWLNKDKQFTFILVAGFLAGLVQGILGVGSGSTMMTFLLKTQINASSASATTGYQVLFIGLAALFEGFINGRVVVEDSAFFIGLCVILGGFATLGMAYFLQTRNQVTVSKIVVIIAVFLSLVSVVMVVPDVVDLINESGFAKTMEIKFTC